MPETEPLDDIEALERVLCSRARQYLPGLAVGDRIEVERGPLSGGPLSTIYPFSLTGSGVRLDLIVKMPPSGRRRATGGARLDSRRPRLAPVLDQDMKFRWEMATLKAIEARLRDVGDERLRSLRVFDFIDRFDAIVLERRSEPTLKQLLRGNARDRLLASRRDPAVEFFNTGVWLRAFHGMSDLAHTETRLAKRSDFLATLTAYCEYLGPRSSRPKYFEDLASRLGPLAAKWLSSEFPLGLGHGDLAPRNILVDESGRVMVLDTRGAWRVPIYEDLAYFLVAVETNRLQSYSLGWAFSSKLMESWRRSFLNGYFGADAVPHRILGLFELQALLDKWASAQEARDTSEARSGALASYTNYASVAALERSAARVLEMLESR